MKASTFKFQIKEARLGAVLHQELESRGAVRTVPIHVGGADRDRTDDLRLAKPALSHLSYGPASEFAPMVELVGLERFELSTPRLSSACSNQLSYRPAPKAHTTH